MAKKFSPKANFKFGWCSHPVEQHNRHKECPGRIAQTVDTLRWKKGEVAFCQCKCHGPDQPPAWTKEVQEDAQDNQEGTPESSDSGNSTDADEAATTEPEKVPA